MPRKEIDFPNHIRFNQDLTCISIANEVGVFVYSLDTHTIAFSLSVGSLRLCCMLFSSSLLAYVGSGNQGNLTPRQISLLNTSSQTVIQDLNFPTTVLTVMMNRQRLVAVLERKTFVYALELLELLNAVDTSANPSGVSALTAGTNPCYLALPSPFDSGCIRVYDAMSKGCQVLAEINAHKSPVAAMAWNHDGSRLVSASDKGTVLRIHSMPQGTRTHSFRRGTSQAQIQCLSFSAAGVQPPMLACGSSHGTLHLWLLRESSASPTTSLLPTLASVIPSSVTDIVDPQRCLVCLRLPSGTPTACAIQKKTEKLSSASMLDSQLLTEEPVCLLMVATEDATLYTYHVQNLSSNSATPVLSLECSEPLIFK